MGRDCCAGLCVTHAGEEEGERVNHLVLTLAAAEAATSCCDFLVIEAGF